MCMQDSEIYSIQYLILFQKLYSNNFVCILIYCLHNSLNFTLLIKTIHYFEILKRLSALVMDIIASYVYSFLAAWLHTISYCYSYVAIIISPTLDHQFIYSSGTTRRWWESISSFDLSYVLHICRTVMTILHIRTYIAIPIISQLQTYTQLIPNHWNELDSQIARQLAICGIN